MYTEQDVVCPVGTLERYQVSLPHFGLDSCVVVSAEYQCPNATLNLQTLYPALRQVVLQHGGLCVQLTNDNPLDAPPRFFRLPLISLDAVVTFVKDEVTSLDDHFMEQLVKPFELETELPLWRLVVLNGCTVFFAYHHSIGNGQSGPAFRSTLLAALNAVQPGDCTDSFVVVPRTLAVVPPVETLTNTSISFWGFCRILLSLFIPKSWRAGYTAWTCNPIPQKPTPKMFVRCWSVPPEQAIQLVKLCRVHGTTLTAFLHTLTSRALAQLVPMEDRKRYKAIATAVPASLRRYTGAPPSALCDQVTVLRSHVPIPPLEEATNPITQAAFPWDTAKNYGVHMHKTMHRNRELIGMIRCLFEFGLGHGHFLRSMGKKRECTLLLSNLGRFPAQDARFVGGGGEDAGKRPRWTIGRVHFTQADGVRGAAIKVNVVGCPNDGLGISFTWSEQGVEACIAEQFVADTKAAVAAILETGV